MKSTLERLQEARVKVGDYVYLNYENEPTFMGRITLFTNEVVILNHKTLISSHRPCQFAFVSLSKSYARRLQKGDHIRLGHMSFEVTVCGYNPLFGLRVKDLNNSRFRIGPGSLDERFMVSWPDGCSLNHQD